VAWVKNAISVRFLQMGPDAYFWNCLREKRGCGGLYRLRDCHGGSGVDVRTRLFL
jgi:hypothetical protein